jgi:hypothetical protein
MLEVELNVEREDHRMGYCFDHQKFGDRYFSIILCIYGFARALTAHDLVLETSVSIVKNGIAGDKG